MPISAHYRPAPRFERLGGAFYDVVEPARFPKRVLRFRNQRWAERVGLGELTAEEWEAAFARFEPLPENLRGPRGLASLCAHHCSTFATPDIRAMRT